MKEFTMVDTITIPATAAAYTKKTFLMQAGIKWVPATLVAVVADLSSVFTELFYIVILLWLCDFAIGFARALVDDAVKVEWIKIIRSVVKLFVIAVGVIAIHSIEHLLSASGIDTHGKLTVAMLLVVGIAEALSVLDNLCYFFPRMGALAERIKGLLLKSTRNGEE